MTDHPLHLAEVRTSGPLGDSIRTGFLVGETGLAVTPRHVLAPEGPWVVTHVASGYNVDPRPLGIVSAVRLALRLSDLADWTADRETLETLEDLKGSPDLTPIQEAIIAAHRTPEV